MRQLDAKESAQALTWASLSALQTLRHNRTLTSLNLDLIMVKVGVMVGAGLEWRGVTWGYSVQVCVGEVCSDDITGCVVKCNNDFDELGRSVSCVLHFTSHVKPA